MRRKCAYTIIDTTLRDGAQMPGVSLTLREKLRIVSALRDAGVSDIESGFAACSLREQNDIRAIVKAFPSLNISVWARAKKSDILAAYETGADTVHISFPASVLHASIISMSTSEVLKSLQELVPFAKRYFSSVTVGAQDATRASELSLVDFMQRAADCGAERIRIADTVGIGTPDSISELITRLKEKANGIGIEFHGHNDFGLATANALAAIRAGAQAISVTVNGVGERGGNAALEQVAAALSLLYKKESTIRLEALPQLCITSAKAFRLKSQPHQPLVGNNAFTHESGIHCHGMLKDPLSYQPCKAAVIGRSEQYVIGKHSGTSTVHAYFMSCGINVSNKFASRVIDSVKSG